MNNHDDAVFDINCGRCGKPLQVRIMDLRDARFVECEACASKPPFNTRQVFVAFDQQCAPKRKSSEALACEQLLSVPREGVFSARRKD
jgi:hypothetical protein